MSYLILENESSNNSDNVQRFNQDLMELYRNNIIGDKFLLYTYLLFQASHCDHDIAYKEVTSKKFEIDTHILNLIQDTLKEHEWEKLKDLL